LILLTTGVHRDKLELEKEALDMKNKKLLWLIPLFIGLVPFVWALIGGLYSAINGFSGIMFGPSYYGFQAFFDWVILFSYIAWPAYLVGLALIGLSLFMLLKKSKV
jgi:hypothetical protein